MLEYIYSLTSHVARFIDRSERQVQLRDRISKLEIPKCCYLALGNSTDTWSSVKLALPNEVHAFSTKARCPALLLFEMQDNIDGLDVATFLGSEALAAIYENSTEGTTSESFEVMVGHSDPAHPTRSFFRSFDEGMARTRRASLSAVLTREGHSITEGADPQDSALMNKKRLSAEAMVVERIKTVEEVSQELPHYENGEGKDVGDGEDEGEDQDVLKEEERENFAMKSARLKAASPIGALPGWRLDGLIAKSNDDLRQEVSHSAAEYI